MIFAFLEILKVNLQRQYSFIKAIARCDGFSILKKKIFKLVLDGLFSLFFVNQSINFPWKG